MNRVLLLAIALCPILASSTRSAAEPWKRHVIDNSSRGADGVRLHDANGDGRLDIATGWEEGGLVRLYLQPDPGQTRRPWPRVTVGKVPSPEDAVIVDLDGDGAQDVVSCCEGKTRSVFVHWSPPPQTRNLREENWVTEAIPQLQGIQQWMFSLPINADDRRGTDLVVGSKGKDAGVTLLLSPEQPRRLAQWSTQRLRSAGWIMSLRAHDVDHDQDSDVVLSDRRGSKRGVYWLENPGVEAVRRGQPWIEHTIGAADTEVMFLTLADLAGDGKTNVVVMAQDASLLVFQPDMGKWIRETVSLPPGFRRGKGVAAGDINADGRTDLVVTTEDGLVAWVHTEDHSPGHRWRFHDISGGVGYKFDRVELLDLDGDGDRDVLTCEERQNLGIVWYENPYQGG